MNRDALNRRKLTSWETLNVLIALKARKTDGNGHRNDVWHEMMDGLIKQLDAGCDLTIELLPSRPTT